MNIDYLQDEPILNRVLQMDETVINGANLFFAPQFGIDINTTDGSAGRNQWLLGLVNSAPYLCCAVLGCWLTDPVRNISWYYYRTIPNCSYDS